MPGDNSGSGVAYLSRAPELILGFVRLVLFQFYFFTLCYVCYVCLSLILLAMELSVF